MFPTARASCRAPWPDTGRRFQAAQPASVTFRRADRNEREATHNRLSRRLPLNRQQLLQLLVEHAFHLVLQNLSGDLRNGFAVELGLLERSFDGDLQRLALQAE